MFIMPKASTKFEQSVCMKEYVDKYKKMEIQFFKECPGSIEINVEEVIDRYVKEFDVNEITIHPPLCNFDIEYLLLRDENFVDNLIDRLIILSKKHNIKINILFHTNLNSEELIYGIAPKIKKCLEKINDENILILVENLFLNPDKEICSIIEFCDYINHPKLKVCLDICHIRAKANLFKEEIIDFINHFIDKEKAKRHVYQIHFSYVANNDGYIDKSTHGIAHPNKDSLIEDVNILEYIGIENKVVVTEIGEFDYFTRLGQKQEIKWLEEVFNF